MRKECVAMLLAGGQGSRLGNLTRKIAKPGVSFGGKYRIIDFSLSNCTNSNIDTVGVLTQYKPLFLNAYIGTGAAWDMDIEDGGVHILPPYMDEKGGEWYSGTADAVYKNLDFIGQYDPQYVLILSGDHIYRMDYSRMLKFHCQQKADATLAVMKVPWEDVSRFGIVKTDEVEEGRISDFEEKPKKSDSNLASMGIYIFNWEVLMHILKEDAANKGSDHDFGKNIIPGMLKAERRLAAYRFSGYWRDVGTVESYYEANMDLLSEEPALDMFARTLRIYSRADMMPPHFIGESAVVGTCLISNGCTVLGTVNHSVVSGGVTVEAGAVVKDSILLPGCHIKSGANLYRCIVGENSIVPENAQIGDHSAEARIVLWEDDQLMEAETEVV
ncbi:MAG: glucose-1-phosphate adenylyltransferase [Syntrophomonadaceae bacterium]|nr:glucose-1-phosphate adenylyltransferase [Syntrophomonadaceae bacterium]